MRHVTRPAGLTATGRTRLAPIALIVLTGLLAAPGILVGCTASESGSPPTKADAPAGDTAVPALPPGSLPFVPTPLPVTDNFVAPDSRGVVLDPVMNNVTALRPPLPVRGGTAQLQGTVFGPDGPVSGATVRLERFVGADVGSI